MNSVCMNDGLFHGDVGLMSYALALLFNLTFEMKIFYHLKEKQFYNICDQIVYAKERIIQFASHTLSVILKQEYIDTINSPTTLARNYIFFIEHTIDEISLTYHGITLNGVLTNLE
ncbi:unnamed protein product, partial [Rotaria sp. Silwood2]